MQNQSLNLLIILEYQNAKMSLLKDTVQIGQRRYMSLKRLKILYHIHMLFKI